ncbi:MAG: PEP-CTERM sorting domain-containing protein [Armatimonadota bacterium]
MMLLRVGVLALGAVLSSGAFAQFSTGNLAVVLVGDGTTALGATGAKTQIVEIDRATGLLTSKAWDLTFNASTRQNGIVLTGNSVSEGGLNSYNGKAVLGGYSAAVGTGSLGNLATKRALQVDYGTGGITFSDFIAGGNIRSVATSDGSTYFAAMSTAGVMKGVTGNLTPTFVSGTDTNIRFTQVGPGVEVFYSINGSGGGFMKTTNTGNAASWSTAANTIGIADFAFSSDGLNLYLAADAGTTPGAGVYRLSRTSTSSAFTGAATRISDVATRYLTLYETGTSTSVYATRRPTNVTSTLVALDGADTATTVISPSWSFTTSANQVVMGVDLVQVVPEPATLAVLGLGLGVLTRRRKSR